MRISICSFSFHRYFAAGKQDIFQYIKDCKALGCTELDPWNAHLTLQTDPGKILEAGRNPAQSHHLAPADEEYLRRVKAAADAEGIPFGLIACDGCHVYEPTREKRAQNRAKAYHWIAIAKLLGAKQMRIDCGGSEELPDEMLDVMVDGYNDLAKRAGDAGIQILMENHWAASVVPENVCRIMEAVPAIKLLLDSWNWKFRRQLDGWLTTAKYAGATHIKTFMFNDRGEEMFQNIPSFIRMMVASGYKGGWGIESVPRDGDEMAAARNTIALIKKTLAEKN